MKWRMRRSWWLPPVLALALLLPACTGEQPETAPPPPTHTPMPTTGLESFYSQKITWRPCSETLECTRINVPLDYDKPEGEKIAVAVNRLKATGNDRIGSLLVNPGGPGVSGVDYLESTKSGAANADVRSRYDIVGFDPRGVGDTAPVDCVTDKRLDQIVAMDATPDSEAEERALARTMQGLAKACADRSPEILPFVGTRHTARDMDILRAVLGDEKLHYLGYSYGTYLGALYADFFPDRVGRMVLDGAIDPAADDDEIVRVQAEGFQQSLRAFVEDCLGREDCPLQGPPDAAMAQIAKLIEDTEIEPLPTGEDRQVTQALATLGIAAALYDAGSWEFLRLALEDALNSQGDGLLILADAYTQREEGKYASNLLEASSAITCMDRRSEADIPAVRELASRLEQISPVFGGYVGWSALSCMGWELPPDSRPGEVHAPGAAPILVVGTTRDPATPLRWAEAMARQLDSATLLVRDGDGHLAYRKGNKCIDQAIDAYLLQGALPDDGKRC